MLTALLVAAAVKAAVSQVTIFSDRARVIRTADVAVDGRTKAELPLLPDTVFPDSIRLEATGADVQKLDIQHVAPDEFPVTEARELLTKLEKLDDQLQLLGDQQNELQNHLNAIRSINPSVRDEPLRPRPKLNARSWGESINFTQDAEQSIRARIRDGALKTDELRRERALIADKARVIGGAGRKSGWRVTAQLDGKGEAHLTLTYLVAQARWTPGYDLQLLSDQKSVRVSFSGEAAQQTGEDWENALMTLSTAIPASARALPEVLTWKIGEQERFIPTPWRANAPPPFHLPPQVPPPAPMPRSESDELRQQLMARAQSPQPQAREEPMEESDALEPKGAVAGALGMMAPMAAPPPPPPASKSMPTRNKRSGPQAPAAVAAMPSAEMATASAQRREPEQPSQQVGIAPPPAWQRPTVPPDWPAAAAGGYDLEFDSVRQETVRSGKASRRVLLFSETWPVSTERLLVPALASEAYLVAQIKNPSDRTLPRGQASLSVGSDPAGTASLPLVAPGQELTLPLGVDKAVRSFRNVAQEKTEKGLFSKDDVTRYAVTIEVQNPYPVPLPLRIVDEVPLQGDKNIEVSLVEAKGAEQDKDTGKLTWKVTAPASGKVKLAFVYQLKSPKGYRVHQ